MMNSPLLAWLLWRCTRAGNIFGALDVGPQEWHSPSAPRAVQRAGTCRASLAFALVDATHSALVEVGLLGSDEEALGRGDLPSVGQAVSCSMGARCYGDESPVALLRIIQRGLTRTELWRYDGTYQLWDPSRLGAAPPCRTTPPGRLAIPAHASYVSYVRPMLGEEDTRTEFMEALMEYGAVVTRIISHVEEAETKRLLDTSDVVGAQTIDAFEDSSPRRNFWVLLCGWGGDEGRGEAAPHWTVKASWGSAWAADGYLRILRYRTSAGVARADVASGLPFALRAESVSSWYPAAGAFFALRAESGYPRAEEAVVARTHPTTAA